MLMSLNKGLLSGEAARGNSGSDHRVKIARSWEMQMSGWFVEKFPLFRN
jgi:hypothetical protein